jgi:serine/threonine-protein kinase
MTDRTLSHYRILHKIGEGGMGEVFLAEDTRLERKTAIKLLRPTVSSNPERLARFDREAKAVASLNHPNISRRESYGS